MRMHACALGGPENIAGGFLCPRPGVEALTGASSSECVGKHARGEVRACYAGGLPVATDRCASCPPPVLFLFAVGVSAVAPACLSRRLRRTGFDSPPLGSSIYGGCPGWCFKAWGARVRELPGVASARPQPGKI